MNCEICGVSDSEKQVRKNPWEIFVFSAYHSII